MKTTLRKYLTSIAAAVLLLTLFVFYATVYPYHFFWHEQNQLFLLDWAWVGQYFDRPAWLACLTGDFLTQFYYYLYAGPAILAAVVTATVWIVYGAVARETRKTRETTGARAARRVAAVLAAVVGLYLTGASFGSYYTLASLLCVTGAAAVALAAGRRPLLAALLAPAVWWLFGYGVLFYCAIVIVGAVWRHRRIDLISVAVSIALTLLVPLCAAHTYTLRYTQALLYPGVPVPTLPEMAVERTLAVDNEYYFGNFRRAADLALHKAPANRMTACYYYLAQAHQDSLPESLLRFPLRELGTLNTIGESTPWPVINMMNDLYYAVGDMLYAERAAMMRNVFSPVNRNARMVKRLAEVNIASGDTLAAKKYLRLLSKTLAYRQWARRYLGADGNMVPGLPTPQATGNDCIRLGDNCRTILTQQLDADPDNTLALDYLLCTDLLLKDMESFKADYDRYCMSRGRPRLRDLYQQALMIYLAGTGADAAEWAKYIRSPQLAAAFRAYSAHRGNPSYSDTYWYYFDTAK